MRGKTGILQKRCYTNQRKLWNGTRRFYAIGGTVKVNGAWETILRPETPEARVLEARYGKRVWAVYERAVDAVSPFAPHGREGAR